MIHETIKIKTADNSPERRMPDNQATMDYVQKLSFASTVTATFDTGEVWTVEAGRRTVTGGFSAVRKDRSEPKGAVSNAPAFSSDWAELEARR